MFVLLGPPLTHLAAGALPFWHFMPPPPYRGSLSSRGSLFCIRNPKAPLCKGGWLREAQTEGL